MSRQYPLLSQIQQNRIADSLEEIEKKQRELKILKSEFEKQLRVFESGRSDMLLTSLSRLSAEWNDITDMNEQERILKHFNHHLNPEDYRKIAPGLFASRSNVNHVSRLYHVPLPDGF